MLPLVLNGYVFGFIILSDDNMPMSSLFGSFDKFIISWWHLNLIDKFIISWCLIKHSLQTLDTKITVYLPNGEVAEFYFYSKNKYK